ncbi:hypothetical protein [Nocardia terpenica]|uniref:hypothetical protein n=1 Tax=Nocardia terpenica TaxID=455432 RepID=UPI0039E01BCD
MYLLSDTDGERIAALRNELAGLGDSVAVVGDGGWTRWQGRRGRRWWRPDTAPGGFPTSRHARRDRTCRARGRGPAPGTPRAPGSRRGAT